MLNVHIVEVPLFPFFMSNWFVCVCFSKTVFHYLLLFKIINVFLHR